MLKSLVASCRSIRSFNESRQVSEDLLRDIIDTARLCPSAANLQPLKYRIVSGDECKSVTPLTKWAAALPELTLPPEGHMPQGFILICHDTEISQITDFSAIDVGIAAETIVLSAAEAGLGSCMIGSFNHDRITALLELPENLIPRLLIAVGYPAESPVLCAPNDGSVKYFRNDAGLHFVPKRPLDEIIIENKVVK